MPQARRTLRPADPFRPAGVAVDPEPELEESLAGVLPASRYPFDALVQGSHHRKVRVRDVWGWIVIGAVVLIVAIEGTIGASRHTLVASAPKQAIAVQPSPPAPVLILSPTPTAVIDPTSASATPTPTPSKPSPTPTKSPSPSVTHTPKKTRPPTPTPPVHACTVQVSIGSQWQGGYVASLTVTNAGSAPIQGWQLAFFVPQGQQVQQAWGASFAQAGNWVTLSDAPYNATVAANGGTVTIGYKAGYWGPFTGGPSGFSLNGTIC